jgi:hypothetical protein
MEHAEHDELSADEQWSRIAADLSAHKAEQRRAWGDIDEAAIARYVTGEASAEERQRLEQAMRDFPRVQECVDSIREIMDDLPVQGAADLEPSAEPILVFEARPRPVKGRLPANRMWLMGSAAAAAVVLVGVTTALMMTRGSDRSGALEIARVEPARAPQGSPWVRASVPPAPRTARPSEFDLPPPPPPGDPTDLGAARPFFGPRTRGIEWPEPDQVTPSLSQILAAPEKYAGQDTTPRGVFRLGRRISQDTQGIDTIAVMPSGLKVNVPEKIAVATDDGAAATLELEPGLAARLLAHGPWRRDGGDGVNGRGNVGAWEKHVAILTVSVSRDARNPADHAWACRVRRVEFLLNVDSRRVIGSKGARPFQTYTVATDRQGPGLGDPEDWQKRLGPRFPVDASLVALAILRARMPRVPARAEATISAADFPPAKSPGRDETGRLPAAAPSSVVRIKSEATRSPQPAPSPAPAPGAIFDQDIRLDFQAH